MVNKRITWRPTRWKLYITENRKHGSAIVASCTLRQEEDGYLSLWDLLVGPPWRRRGLGAQLTQACLDYAKKHRQRLWLRVVADNAPAIALYRKLGFVECQFGPEKEGSIRMVHGADVGRPRSRMQALALRLAPYVSGFVLGVVVGVILYLVTTGR